MNALLMSVEIIDSGKTLTVAFATVNVTYPWLVMLEHMLFMVRTAFRNLFALVALEFLSVARLASRVTMD